MLTLGVACLLHSPEAVREAGANDWPGWRGIEREGRAEPGAYPTHWSPDTKVRWKTLIPGHGHSSPIIVGDKVFVTTAYFSGRGAALRRAANIFLLATTAVLAILGAAVCLWWPAPRRPRLKSRIAAIAGLWLILAALVLAARNRLLPTKELARAIACLDRDTGAVRWMAEGLPGPRPVLSHRNSPATPTPAANGRGVYAWFGSPGAMCAGLDGKVLWTNPALPFECVHGPGPSPILAAGRLIVPGMQAEAPYIAALDPETGQRLWTTLLRPWAGVEGQHRTPATAAVEEKHVLLVWAWDGAAKEDLLRGLDIQSGKELWRHPVPTYGEQVASVVSDGDTVFLPTSAAVTALSLSKLSRGEAPLLWVTELKSRGQLVASPVLCNGLLFVVSAHRDAHCLDARTGELLWSRQLRGRGCMASPIAAGGAVYFPDISGKVTVIAPEREFRTIAENDLGEALWASPAAVGGRLYIRTAAHLWCIEGDPSHAADR